MDINEKKNALIEKLNAPTPPERLAALSELKAMIDAGEITMTPRGTDIKTIFTPSIPSLRTARARLYGFPA